jgi:hypothetical protein
MRAFLLAAALILLPLACSGSTTSSPVTAAVQGTVQDSLAGKAAAGVTVGLAGQSATTDFLGSYQFAAIPTGAQTLTLSPAGFEPYLRAVTVSGPATFNVPLRRLAPFLKDFAGSSNSGTLTATYVDLQGAATITLGSSFVTISGSNAAHSNFTFLNGLGPGSIAVLDAVTAHISINTGQTGIRTATWNVRDSGGNFRTVVCVIGSSCTEQ